MTIGCYGAAILASLALQPGDPELAPGNAQVYAVVSERDIAGTGFLIGFEDETYAVTSVSGHDGSPTSLVGPDHAEVQLGPRVYAQNDIQLFQIERRLTDPSEPFAYDGPSSFRSGERLAVVTLYGIVVFGTLRGDAPKDALLPGRTQTTLEIATDEPVHAPDASGSPVISIDSGTVVGVVTGVDHEEHVSVFAFEPLAFDGVDMSELTNDMFVGRWLTGSGAMVTEIALEPDGAFVAKFLVGSSFLGKVTGHWELQPERQLVWTYDKDNGLIRSDRIDNNKILRYSRNQFSVRELDGSISVFTRK